LIEDERARIAGAIREAAAEADVVLTSGGTGIAPRDVTPEATRDVVEKELPGFGEAMRAASRAATPFADLSRATAGVAGRALVVNLPGSPKGARECLAVVLPMLQHAVRVLSNAASDGEHRARNGPVGSA
jgi:molybdenum cofactor synthesis domain-containing protein